MQGRVSDSAEVANSSISSFMQAYADLLDLRVTHDDATLRLWAQWPAQPDRVFDGHRGHVFAWYTTSLVVGVTLYASEFR